MAYIYTETVQKRGVFRKAQVSSGAGSGFIWDLSGHVVTNNHVVEGATTVFVQLDAGKPIAATVIGDLRPLLCHTATHSSMNSRCACARVCAHDCDEGMA